jgi:hypothetical protein
MRPERGSGRWEKVEDEEVDAKDEGLMVAVEEGGINRDVREVEGNGKRDEDGIFGGRDSGGGGADNRALDERASARRRESSEAGSFFPPGPVVVPPKPVPTSSSPSPPFLLFFFLPPSAALAFSFPFPLLVK